MARSGVLEKSCKTLADLDAFVDESIDAKNEKELSAFKKLSAKIMRGVRRRHAAKDDVSESRTPAHESTR